MKRILLAILIVLVVAQSAWGASITRYVVPDGAGTQDGTSWANAYALPTTAINEMKSTEQTGTGFEAGHILYIAPGTYTDTISVEDGELAGMQIIGTAASGSTVDAAYGQVIIQPAAGSHGLLASSVSDNITVKNIVFRISGNGQVSLQGSDGSVIDGFRLRNVHVESVLQSTNHLLYLAFITLDAKWCTFRFHASAANKYFVRQIAGTGMASTWNYCIFSSSLSGVPSGTIRIQGGTATFNNCIVTDGWEHGIYAFGGTVNVNNSIVQGGIFATGYALNDGATLNASNNIVLGGIVPTGYIPGALDTDSNNQYGVNPLWTTTGKKGYLILRFDDYGTLATVQALEPVLAAKGQKASWYFSTMEYSSDDAADIRSLITNGTVEVGLHGYSHSALSYTHGLNFSQTGGANCTVALGGTPNTITLDCDGTDYDNTLDVTNASYNTLGEIITALHGVKGWTVAKSTTDSQSAVRINDNIKATSFASMVATPAPCDLDFNVSAYDAGFFNDEITAPIAAMKTAINPTDTITDGQTSANWEVKTMGYPFNLVSAGSRTATINAGYEAVGGNLAATPGSIHDIDLYAIFNVAATTMNGADEATTRKLANNIAMLAAQSGLIIQVYGHAFGTMGVAGEPSEAQWGFILDEWAKFGSNLTVTSTQLASAAIKASYTDDEDGTWSKTYASFTGDYRLQGCSPAINAGTNLCATLTTATDFAGNPVCGGGVYVGKGSAPEIGAYEYLGGDTLQYWITGPSILKRRMAQ